MKVASFLLDIASVDNRWSLAELKMVPTSLLDSVWDGDGDIDAGSDAEDGGGKDDNVEHADGNDPAICFLFVAMIVGVKLSRSSI